MCVMASSWSLSAHRAVANLTMLRMVAGLESITAGDLLIDGQKVNERGPAERGAAMVFQSYALYPHMTVAQNMGFGLRMGGTPKADVTRQVQAAAETLQDHPPARSLPQAAVGRAAPAGGDRAGHCAQAQGVFV